MSSLNRRTFLTLTGGAAAASVVGSLSFTSAAHAQSNTSGTGRGDARVLVVVDMQGGNDALNTFVPQTGLYRRERPTLALSDEEMLTFAELDYGVNPGLASLEGLWDKGQITAIYGTGLKGQGRSHFVAQDAWRTARPNRPAQSGWIGRWLEASPLDDPSPLRTVALGQSILATQGQFFQPVAIQSVSGIDVASPLVAQAVSSMSNLPEPGLFGEVQKSIPRTLEAVGELEDLIGSIQVTDGADPDADSSLFKATTAIIQGDAGAQVIYVTINGFDTHALQAQKQEFLLRVVADGLSTMFEELDQSGHAENTLAMVVSEFGRRVAENGSAGTDHGRGGLSFLIGPSVKRGTVIGEPDLTDLVEGDLRITTDARTMYDSALRWLGASGDQVVEVLGDEWQDRTLLNT